MRIGLPFSFLALVGCGTPSSPPAQTAPTPEPLPVPDIEPPVPEPVADPHAGDCPVHFTSQDANEIFGVASGFSSETCTFDSVRVSGSRLALTWKKEDEATVTVSLATAGCAEGKAVGKFVVVEDGGMPEACPTAFGKLEAGLADGTVPEATGRLQLGQHAPGEGANPGPPHPEKLPPRLPPGKRPPDGTPKAE